MRLPQTDANDPTKIDQELFNEMVNLYMEKGFNYFDTSFFFFYVASEVAMK